MPKSYLLALRTYLSKVFLLELVISRRYRNGHLTRVYAAPTLKRKIYFIYFVKIVEMVGLSSSEQRLKFHVGLVRTRPTQKAELQITRGYPYLLLVENRAPNRMK